MKRKRNQRGSPSAGSGGLPGDGKPASEITRQRRIEGELASRLRLQKLLATLSSRFVGLPFDQVDEAIKEAQRLIVETLNLDRSTLWQIVEGRPGMTLTHSWQRAGWPPLPLNFETENSLPWSHRKVASGEGFSFTNIGDLPPEAAVDAEMFLIHGPKSNLTIPLIAGGEVFGALAFATLGREREWLEEEITDLKLLAQIVGNVVGRQRAEIRAEQLRSEIMHSARAAMLGELAAALAHEVNQPLSAIVSNAQAARRFMADGGISPGELDAILGDIVRDGKRGGRVIHNLRTMLSKTPLDREVCQINEIIREVSEFLRGKFLDEKIEVRRRLGKGLPRVEVERVELQQVIMNLLMNAIHAMRDAPREFRMIEISSTFENNAVVIRIRDHGSGIPKEQLSSIFAPFFTTKSGGLGMGLAICRRFIEAHAGRIEAVNHRERGAIFSFSLPGVVSNKPEFRG